MIRRPPKSTRTDPLFPYTTLFRSESAIKAGATTINVPDTVGYTVPEEYTALMRFLIGNIPNSDKARFSAHCHNDLGLAVANSLAAVQGGARPVECRSAERRVGKECVSTCRSRWSPCL